MKNKNILLLNNKVINEIFNKKNKVVSHIIIAEKQKQHALKRHSNEKKEQEKWKQLPLTKSDLRDIPTIINDYDFIDEQGYLRFGKYINNHCAICCCQIRNEMLIFKTMYIKPIEK